jgi:succinate dehydrogenase / fumarate reductase, cytochrome b subunit
MAVLMLYRSTIGKKLIMAVTGFILVGYVIGHMWGNLHIYEGPAAINTYGVFLREFGEPFFGPQQALWAVRVVLLAAVVLHVVAAVQLTQLDLESRPVGYRSKRIQQASYASRTMRYGGVIIALFIIYHLLHLTTGTLHPSFEEGNIYHNLIAGFRIWYVSLFYILAMLALGLHLYHGVWSMFQTLGLNNPGRTRFWGGVALVAAVAVTVGNISVPLAVLTGLVR